MCSYVCLTHTHIKVKSMQIFKKPVAKATQGDRAAGGGRRNSDIVKIKMCMKLCVCV